MCFRVSDLSNLFWHVLHSPHSEDTLYTMMAFYFLETNFLETTEKIYTMLLRHECPAHCKLQSSCWSCYISNMKIQRAKKTHMMLHMTPMMLPSSSMPCVRRKLRSSSSSCCIRVFTPLSSGNLRDATYIYIDIYIYIYIYTHTWRWVTVCMQMSHIIYAGERQGERVMSRAKVSHMNESKFVWMHWQLHCQGTCEGSEEVGGKKRRGGERARGSEREERDSEYEREGYRAR